VRVLHIEGTLFFGAAGELRDALTEAAADPEVKALVVRLKRTRGLDLTAATVFSAVAKNLEDRGKHLILVGMRPAVMGVMERTGVVEDVGQDNAFPTQPGWFEAMDDGLRRALELAEAGEDSPLYRYLALREERAAEAIGGPAEALSPGCRQG
jgi:SulP family sulfate permease